MTRVLEPAAGGTIALDDFLDHLEHDLRVADTESLAQAAQPFKQLLNNRRVLVDFLDRELRAWRDGRGGHDYISHSLVLARRPNFFVRANLWIPPDRSRPLPSPQDPGFSYLRPHDHNFALLTGGFAGPGYVTTLFEYDEQGVAGVPGEGVEIRPCGRAVFPEGTIMLYEPSRDIHVQEHPAELSISLNVIVPGPYAYRPQYFFDVKRGQVDDVIAPAGARGTTLCALAAAIGDGHTAELLTDVARSAPDPRVRVAAAAALGTQALAGLCASSELRVRELARLARREANTARASRRIWRA